MTFRATVPAVLAILMVLLPLSGHAQQTNPTNKPATILPKASARVAVQIVDAVKLENGRPSSAGRQSQELKRKVSCANGADDRDKQCNETIFDIE